MPFSKKERISSCISRELDLEILRTQNLPDQYPAFNLELLRV